MVNKIIDGISLKLYETFGETYRIYTEEIKQGLTEPCFFIQLLDPGNAPLVDKRTKRDHLFAIQYFPKSLNKARRECQEILELLYIALEYINVGEDLVRGIGMKGDITDGILTLTISFNVILRELVEETQMEGIEGIQINTKG